MAAVLVLSGQALAYEPDVDQTRGEKFGRYPSFEDSDEWVLAAKDGKYVLTSWRLSQKEPPWKARTQRDKRSQSVSRELAASIYSIWANGILEARYSRNSPGMDGTAYEFSTYLRGVGRLGAWAWSPHDELPPKWLVDAGELMIVLSRDAEMDEARALALVKKIGDRLASYPSTPEDRPNKSLERTRAR